METKTVTAKELALLNKIVKSEYQGGIAKEIVAGHHIWREYITETVQENAVFGSLLKKGLVGRQVDKGLVNGMMHDTSTVWVTAEGYDAWNAAQPKPVVSDAEIAAALGDTVEQVQADRADVVSRAEAVATQLVDSHREAEAVAAAILSAGPVAGAVETAVQITTPAALPDTAGNRMARAKAVKAWRKASHNGVRCECMPESCREDCPCVGHDAPETPADPVSPAAPVSTKAPAVRKAPAASEKLSVDGFRLMEYVCPTSALAKRSPMAHYVKVSEDSSKTVLCGNTALKMTDADWQAERKPKSVDCARCTARFNASK